LTPDLHSEDAAFCLANPPPASQNSLVVWDQTRLSFSEVNVYVFPKSNSGVLRVDPENRVLSPKASFFEIEFHVGHLGTRILDVRSQFNDSYF
jgi:hypothetical protein